MKMRVTILLNPVLLLIMFIVNGCGESVDPVKGEINLQMKAVTEMNTINSSARVAETGIEFTEVILGVTEIELEGMSEEHDDDSSHDDDDDSDDGSDDNSDDDGDDHGHHDDYEIEFEGQFIVDLLNGTSDPDFGITNVFPGEYKELEIKVSPILDDGNSIRIKLNINQDGTDPLPIEITTSRSFELEIEHKGGIKVDLNDLNQILVLFDLDELFKDVDLSNLEIDNDGVARISESSNASILASIWSALHDAFDACEDNDDDDEFDDHDDHGHDD